MRRLPDRIARHLAAADPRPDGDLLAAFRSGGPAADADFAELVRRHGPLVWGVCRRTLPAAADAEDAFQAVFLVLARRAGRLTAAPTVGPWLYRVAALTARNVRRNARRLARTAALPPDLPAPAADPDLALDLDAALLDLPDKYRSPIVLCHLLGFTRTEAAARLGCPEGTLSAWLSRGLTKLRARLGGHDPAKLLVLAAASVPTGLAASATRAVGAAATASVPSAVSLIAEGVLRMFWVKKATAAAAALSAVFALGVGVGMSARVAVPTADGQEKVSAAPQPRRVPPAADTVEEIDEVIRGLEREALEAAVQLRDLRVWRIAADAQFLGPAGGTGAGFAAVGAALGLPLREAEDRSVALAQRSEALRRERVKLVNAAKPGGGFVLLSFGGDAKAFEITLSEAGADGKVIGTANVSGEAMLAKLLARTRADPTAPTQLRVVPTFPSMDTLPVLRACDAAGYKTVRYTGVVGAGPEAKWLDAVERPTADLVKEIEAGRRKP
ncbi:MAG: hypothetical protein C0501_10795 [Isosphaera sp.]|nr:hypothetical protein [Isosphaera sp.]